MTITMMQIADLPRHMAPWVDSMYRWALPAGTKVYATRVGDKYRVEAVGSPIIADVPDAEMRDRLLESGWIVHHTSLIPLSCHPAPAVSSYVTGQ